MSSSSARRLIGLDLVDFAAEQPGLELYRRDRAAAGLPAASVNLAHGRAAMEHVADPDAVFFAELGRVLKPGGVALALTANKWDHASIIARAIPDRFDPWMVRRTEGRAEHDVFPTVYKVDACKDVAAYASRNGLDLAEFRYLGRASRRCIAFKADILRPEEARLEVGGGIDFAGKCAKLPRQGFIGRPEHASA